MEKPQALTTTHIGTTDSKKLLVPSYCTLTGFTDSIVDRRGLHVGKLEALTRIEVKTRNTLYQITVLEPKHWKIVVHGGRFFPVETIGYLCGSGYGGTLIKVAWIGIGLCCEISTESLRVVTSPVVDFRTVEQDLPGPF